MQFQFTIKERVGEHEYTYSFDGDFTFEDFVRIKDFIVEDDVRIEKQHDLIQDTPKSTTNENKDE